MPNYWNIALFDVKGAILAFQYGTWDPLGGGMHLIRLTIQPKMFRIDGAFLEECMNACVEYARDLNMHRAYFLTCHWKAIKRKMGDKITLAETRVMEVYPNG